MVMLSTALVLGSYMTGLLGAEAWTRNFSPRVSSSTSLRMASPVAAVSNVVLAPSADPEKFDSYKIGSARVHRYSRKDDEDSNTAYVMWYHGRSFSMKNAENGLPPLSTGRIGRAVSRNGLVWEKDTVGSASEDIPGVSLGLNKESWWAFDTAHVGLGNVLLPMETPAVRTEGGVYMMYYMGGNYDETPATQYMSAREEDLPEKVREMRVKGMDMKIGVALSQDGITWGRVEGDHHTGACIVPHNKGDPNSEPGAPSIEEELYCGWPEVVVDLYGEKSRFHMYYSTMTKEGKIKCIAHATSEDGFRWSKKGVCLRPDPEEGSMDSNGCARCCVIQDAVFDVTSNSWEDLDSWKIYYEGVASDGKHRIMMAESSRLGGEWKKRGVVLDVGEEGLWDSEGVGSPSVVRMDDGIQRLYYTGQGKDGKTAIGVAKLASNKATTWEREQASISFS